MKKKFFTVIFSLIAAIACFFGMAACEPKHEHAYKEEVISPTCENRGYTLHKCDCGEKYETDYVGALGHEFGLYESDGNATYTADGTKTAHCTREGCDKADTVTDTDSKLKSCVIFNTLTKTGENEYKAVVSNAQETFSFVTEVENIGLAEYTVTTDEYGIQQVLTKVAPLNEGDNTFYVFETIDGKITNTYKTTIRRKPTYTVTFDAKGGTAAESQTVEEDSFASAPTEASTRAGYTFDKWDFDFATPITENVTISAKWTANTDTAYKVEYYLKNLENDEYTLQSDETENKTGTTDTTAIAEIKTFAHFTYNESVSTISGNIDGNGSRVLKVYYTRDEYTVTFDGNGGTLQSGNATQTVKYGGTAVAPVYIKTGYSLQWDKPLDNIGGSQTIKARWKVNQYTLTIVYGNGKADEELTQDYGSAITVQDPTRDGYAFDGWNKTIPTTMPAENVTVTAEWKAIFRRGNGVIYGLTDWGKTLSKIEIPDAIDGMDVVSIGEEAFCECENLTIVTIGNNILSIGNNAFKGCLLLNSITIPDSVTSIGGSAFYNCSSLTSMTIPDSVTSIGDYMFYCCRGLTSITIPDSVTSIGDSAFGCCFKLVEVINRSSLPIEKGSSEYGSVAYFAVTIHDGESKIIDKNGYLFITVDETNYLLGYTGTETNLVLPNDYDGKNYQIYEHAFYCCFELTSITIPDGVTSIGDYAFHSCTGLTSVTILGGVTSIGDSAFRYCTGLTSVTIPGGVTSIDYYAFYDCSKLTSVYYGGTIDDWAQIAFGNYSANPLYYAEKLYIDNKLVTEAKLTTATKISAYAFYNWSSLTSVTIPDSVTSIGDDAFYYCTGLTSITILGGVTSIGGSAFSGCSSLTSVTIPDRVTSIGDYAFSGCSSLTSVFYTGTAIEWAQISIYVNNSYLTSATRYYYSETKPTNSGNYWHYDENGNVAVW